AQAFLNEGIKRISTATDKRSSRWCSFGQRENQDELIAIVETGEKADRDEVALESGAPVDRATEPVDRLADIPDRVAASLLQKGKVTKSQVREAELHWRRHGQKETLWRVLAAYKGVDQETVYAEAARIYAFDRAKIDREKLDTGLIQRVVGSFSRDLQDRMLGLRVLPIEYEIDAERGVMRLIFATRDPMRPETLRLIHDLHLDHFELRYA